MKKSVCLIIHGFGGSPAEIKYLERYLSGKGIETRTVLLAGHGGTKKELSASSYRDWICTAKKAVKRLSRSFDVVNLVGFSMGGLICAHLASFSFIGKMVFVNTPVVFWNLKIIAADIISGLQSGSLDKISMYRKSVANVSIKTSVDFLLILFKSLGKFPSVNNESLILQCRNDESVHYGSAKRLKRWIRKSKMKYYAGGCHQVFECPELKDLVCEDVYRFLKRV